MSSSHPTYFHPISEIKLSAWIHFTNNKIDKSEEQEHAKRKKECVLRLWATQVSRSACDIKVINLEAMAEVLDELGYAREVTKDEVVSAFCQVIDPEQYNSAANKLHGYATIFF